MASSRNPIRTEATGVFDQVRPGYDHGVEGAVATGRLELTLPAEAGSVTEARQAMGRYLESLDAAENPGIALAVSEAVGNAVVHAYADRPPGTIALRATVLVPNTLVVDVTDDGNGMSPHPDSPGLGFGLALIGELSTGFAVERNLPHGTRVAMRFPLAPHQRPAVAA
jgi:anti-sigma regulatory factor (Ser/Thr protein kinase)